MKEATLNGNITTPGNMTILEIMGDLHLFTGKIEHRKELEMGKVYALNFGRSITLSPKADLELPEKIYDFNQEFRKQILTTLRNPNTASMNLGVLLEGYKGQGKSLEAMLLAKETGLPIVMITNPISRDYDFTEFLNSIKQDYVLLIDEFEKLFPKVTNLDKDNGCHSQDSFLSFMSGTTAPKHKRLVILTTNDEIGDKFINRPSRIRYYKKYNFMSKQVFNAILDDKLIHQHHRQDLVDQIDVASCTIDLLNTIIEEINIHDKPYSYFKEFFNHKERDISYSRYKRAQDGTWKWIDDVTTKREITQDNADQIQNVVGYGAKILKFDENIIYYTIDEWVYESTGKTEEEEEDDNGKRIKVKNTYKLSKQTWSKTDMAF